MLFFESVEVELPNEGRVVVVTEVLGQQVFGELGGTHDDKGVTRGRPADAVAIFRVLLSKPRRFRSMIE